jgi:hypothetical protein
MAFMSLLAANFVELVQGHDDALSAAIARLDEFNPDIWSVIRQLADFVGQHLQGDRRLVVGVLMDDQLGEVVFSGGPTGQIRHMDNLHRHGGAPSGRRLNAIYT